MRTVRLADIAKKTGYSVNTVSHALKDREDISVKTKKYIAKVAEEMGYIRNVSASSLRSGQSNCVAIIVSDITNPHFSILVKEMEICLRSYDYNAFVINTMEDESTEKRAIISAIEKNVDGILLCPVQYSSQNIEFLHKMNVPFVLFGRKFDDNTSNYVVCDDEQGGFLAAEYLLKSNHHKILFINGAEWISSSKERLAGIMRAQKQYHDLECHIDTVFFDVLGNIQQTEQIVANHRDCTAIICFSDMIAYQVCYCLKKLQLRVPEDVSVIGFDDITSKYYFPLNLTSITSSKTTMSIQSVKALMDIINKKIDSIHLTLPTKLVIRDTTQKI